VTIHADSLAGFRGRVARAADQREVLRFRPKVNWYFRSIAAYKLKSHAVYEGSIMTIQQTIIARLDFAFGRAGHWPVVLAELVAACGQSESVVIATLDALAADKLVYVTRSTRAVDAGTVVCATLRNDSQIGTSVLLNGSNGNRIVE
jgi:hypothetical protein